MYRTLIFLIAGGEHPPALYCKIVKDVCNMNNEHIKLGTNNKGRLVWASYDQIISNATEQEKTGVMPHYAFYDYKNKKAITPPGFLVWSLVDGCGVVYRRADGEMVLIKGVQSDFCYM